MPRARSSASAPLRRGICQSFTKRVAWGPRVSNTYQGLLMQ